mgnify:FL=1
MIFEHEKQEAKSKAKEVLEIALLKEKKEIKKGFKTMVKDKTRVLVNPKNFESKLEQGYKFVS